MTTESKIHPLQKFEVVTIPRSQINFADYNPRSIDDQAKRLLSTNLKSKGLLNTLVWNKTTGNLVSGHQRLSELDAYYQKKFGSLDYELTVAMVELSLKEEIEQNIFFNNARAMGTFDDDLMSKLFSDTTIGEIDFKAAGMLDEDISFYGITNDLSNIDNSSLEETIQAYEAHKIEKKAAISPEEYQERKETLKAAKKQQSTNDIDTLVSISFSNQRDKQAFMELIGEDPKGLYIKGEPFVEKYFS